MSPAQPGGGGGGGERDTGTGLIWIMVGTIVLVAVIWFAGHTLIVEGFFKLKLFEISIVNFFTDELSNVRSVILNTNPATVPFNSLGVYAAAVNRYLTIPFAIILLLFALLLYSKSSVSRFKNNYTMRTLLQFGTKLWPQTKPGLEIDLIKEDIAKGPWAMARNPMEFAKNYRLLQEKAAEFVEGRLRKEAQITVTLIKSRANRIFTIQLGNLWQDVDHLKPHARALYAAFAAKAARDAKTSRELLEKIANSWKAGKVDFSYAEPVLAKYRNDPHVVEITKRHAYEFTVMASVLQLARTDGVLPTADFLWLKPIDRRLWFILNDIGRQTASVEAAGIFAHWLAEKELGRKIKTPMVEQATKALDVAIQDIKYIPDSANKVNE